MPIITQQPTTQRVISGASAAFTVRAIPAAAEETDNTLVYHWSEGRGGSANYRNDNFKF